MQDMESRMSVQETKMDYVEKHVEEIRDNMAEIKQTLKPLEGLKNQIIGGAIVIGTIFGAVEYISHMVRK